MEFQANNLLLTGPPSCGKTTAVLRLVENALIEREEGELAIDEELWRLQVRVVHGSRVSSRGA